MDIVDETDIQVDHSVRVLESSDIRPAVFVFPPAPIGAHIEIVTKREAEDYELWSRWRELIHDDDEEEDRDSMNEDEDVSEY